MKIITVCKEGNNRSVHFAHLLKYKYKGSDVLPIGIASSSKETQKMLFDWADFIIMTDKALLPLMPQGYEQKLKIWNVGEDRFHRPFNKELHELVKLIIKDNPLVLQ